MKAFPLVPSRCRWLLVLSLVGAGCAHDAPKPLESVTTVVKVPAPTPSETLIEQLRSGAYQVDTAIATIEGALTEVSALSRLTSGTTREGLGVSRDLLESSGATLGDLPSVAPTLSDLTQNLAKFEKVRRNNLTECLDAHHELIDAQGQIEALVEAEKSSAIKVKLENLTETLDEALESLEGAITAYGGKVPEEPSAEETS